MDMAGILPLSGRDIHELSGGERQRVWIARALAQQPDIMLLDEPTAFQDIRHQVDFFNLIRNLNRNRGLTVVAVTHDINLASSFCDRLVLLNQGGVFASGHPDQVITERHLLEVYAMDVLVDQSPVDGRPRLTLAGKDHNCNTGVFRDEDD
jgi:iron complex transport system ATP-binding protein